MSEPEGQTDDTLSPGTSLGRYQISRLIGRGGMGAVYEGIHRDLKKRVAIKVLSSAMASEEAKHRFLREGEAASRIQHPNVVDVTDVGMEGSLSYLVMEYLEGEDLAHRLARDGAIAPRDAADLLLPVCAGLAVAHDEGVVHRDLKPENIFLVRQRHGGVVPKLLDFGISKLTGRDAAAMTRTIATFGTPYYMPPEQVRGAREADQRSDVYALGVVLYECVTGRRPFETDNLYSMLHAIGAGAYTPPRQVRPELPAEVEAVIVRAMNVDPGGRFQSVRQLAAALRSFASEKARLLWAEAFAGAEAALPAPDGAPATAVGFAGASGPGSVSAAGAPAPARTNTGFPGEPPRPLVTAGSATGYQLEGRPANRSWLAVVVGAALTVGVLVLIGTRLIRPAHPVATVSSEPAAPVASQPATPAPPPSPPDPGPARPVVEAPPAPNPRLEADRPMPAPQADTRAAPPRPAPPAHSHRKTHPAPAARTAPAAHMAPAPAAPAAPKAPAPSLSRAPVVD